MRIVHIVHSYFPKIGGIERAVQFLAETQARLGNEVAVLTSNADLLDVPKKEVVNGTIILLVYRPWYTTSVLKVLSDGIHSSIC